MEIKEISMVKEKRVLFFFKPSNRWITYNFLFSKDYFNFSFKTAKSIKILKLMVFFATTQFMPA